MDNAAIAIHNAQHMRPTRPVYSPLYQQVRQHLLDALSAGEWRAGDVLPSEFTLADRFGVSQGTARKALDALVSEGLLVRRQGVGTFVADWPGEWEDGRVVMTGQEFSQHADRVSTELLTCGRATASDLVAEALELRRAAPLALIRRTLRIESQTVGFEEIALPAERFDRIEPRLIKQYGGQLYRMYAVEFGARIGRRQEWFSALREVDEGWVRFPDSVPVQFVERLSFDSEQQPVEWRRLWLDGRRCRYRVG